MRDLNSRFEAAVALRKFALGLDARRGVAAKYSVGVAVALSLRGDDKFAVLHLNVVDAIRVVLEFVIAPAVSSGLDNLFGFVGSGAVSAIEFVIPDHVPFCRGDCGRSGRPGLA